MNGFVNSKHFRTNSEGLKTSSFVRFVSKVFRRVGDHHTIVQHLLPRPVSARYLLFYPRTWIDRPCLRVEIYGKKSEC